MSKPRTGQPHTKSRAKRRRPAKTAYPSFAGLKPASQASSQAKRANKSRGTRQEVILQRALRQFGFHFKRNVKSLPGKPDIVLPDEKVVLFCDGDFWHGRNWMMLRRRLSRGSNGEYWTAKIASNIRNDKKVRRRLRAMGYSVLRVWESEVKDRPDTTVQQLKDCIGRNSSG